MKKSHAANKRVSALPCPAMDLSGDDFVMFAQAQHRAVVFVNGLKRCQRVLRERDCLPFTEMKRNPKNRRSVWLRVVGTGQWVVAKRSDFRWQIGPVADFSLDFQMHRHGFQANFFDKGVLFDESHANFKHSQHRDVLMARACRQTKEMLTRFKRRL